jgi:probable rRNA maturation factor
MQATIIVKRSVPGISERALQRFASQAGRAVGLQGWITVLITGSREIAKLNGQFRKKKTATDVLSFRPPAFRDGFAGDIAISIDIAAHSARKLGHSVTDEIRVLILHGVLHLAGYDHEADDGKMAEMELRLRRLLDLPVTLIERTVAPARSNSGRHRLSKRHSPRSRV